MRQKGFAPILIILLVLVAIGGAYYFGTKRRNTTPAPNQNTSSITTNTPLQTTPNPTANWETYTDQDWKFSIKYPKSYVFTPKSIEASYISIHKPGGEVPQTESFDHFTIIIEKSSSVTVDEAISSEMKYARDLFDINTPFTNITTIKIGGVDAKSYYHPGYGYQQYIFVQHPDTKIILQFTISFANKSVQESEQSEVDQILSTFKFTK